MHPDGHVDSFKSFDEDRTVDIKQRLFFKFDMAKSRRFILDKMDGTYR